MKKQFILNLIINLGIVFLVISAVQGYQSENKNILVVGGSIALLVVLIYLKVVLLKYVKQEVTKQKLEKEQTEAKGKKNKKG